MAVQFKLDLVVISDDDQHVSVDEDLAATFRRWYSRCSLADQPAGDNLLGPDRVWPVAETMGPPGCGISSVTSICVPCGASGHMSD
jgi:hypothetical protein